MFEYHGHCTPSLIIIIISALSFYRLDQGSSVVDMSLLWLWWVDTHRHTPVGWKTGRPMHSLNPRHTEQDFRARSDKAFEYTKTLKLPPEPVTTRPIHVCNGLDVVGRTVFDHMRGWSDAPNMTLIDTTAQEDPSKLSLAVCPHCPYVVADALLVGGVPESREPSQIERLKRSRLYFLSLHFQGDTKKHLLYDVCRVLIFTGTRHIRSAAVRNLCAEELKGFEHQAGATKLPPCMPHQVYDRSGKPGPPKELCF